MEAIAPFKFKEITASWDGADGYVGHNLAGATMYMGKPEAGTPVISPTEAMLLGLAGCTAIDVIEILRKKRQLPTDLKVRVWGKQLTEGYPRLFVEFQVEYLIWGENLEPRAVEQAIHLSEQKYCSVGATLAKAGPIHSTYRILRPGEAAD
jgi:putative redox protein